MYVAMFICVYVLMYVCAIDICVCVSVYTYIIE